MCGVAGYLDFIDPPQRPRLERMTARLQHRGPDGNGYYLDSQVALGHTRLSIIDLGGGAQPIHNENETVWVVFNGEIFNYIELRAELESAGHRFYTHSDTEVIVHLYEQYGDDFVRHLNGQFAIALWDASRQRLLLIRDRVGIAPLYYCQDGTQLFFGSEIKAVVAGLGRSPRLSAAGIDQIFTFWSPVSPGTAFEGVLEVRPGTYLVCDRQGIREQRYWDWQFPVSKEEYWSQADDELAERLHDLLVDATQIRLRSDVPVGAYLSGGLDSSVLVALIHHHSDAPLRTFSIGFDAEGLDESSFQQIMIRHLGAEHSRIQCSNAQVGQAFVDTIWHAESPILRTAPVPMRLLSGLVRGSHYKVVLTGEGSDEALGGYDIFKEAKVRQFWARQPASESRPLLFKRLYPYLDVQPGKAAAYFKSFFGVGLEHADNVMFSHLPRWQTTAKAKLFFSDALQGQLRDKAEDVLLSKLPADMAGWHHFNRAQYIEAKSLMGGYLLCSQGDRMLMANSVEGRFPFLDHRVIEFANRLPPTLKMRGLNEKYLLKKAMAKYLPEAIVNRHKQPYRAPDTPAFFDTSHHMLPFAKELMSEAKIQGYGYFDAKKVSMLNRKVERGGAIGYKDNQAWVGILSTQVLHHLFIENYHARF